jgi:hypothetical protein
MGMHFQQIIVVGRRFLLHWIDYVVWVLMPGFWPWCTTVYPVDQTTVFKQAKLYYNFRYRAQAVICTDSHNLLKH